MRPGVTEVHDASQRGYVRRELCYRFVDKLFSSDRFFSKRTDLPAWPLTPSRRLGKRHLLSQVHDQSPKKERAVR